MSDKRTDEEKLDALIDFLGDSIFEASDEEIREEVRMSGVDPDTEAVRLKHMMLNAVKAIRQRALKTSREAYDDRITHLETKHYSIPNTPEERRRLFSFISQQPQSAPYVTAQYRNLKDPTDNDIESYLKDLDDLGLLDKLLHDSSDEK